MNDIDEKCDRNSSCDVRKKQKRRINIKSSNVFQHLQLSRKKKFHSFYNQLNMSFDKLNTMICVIQYKLYKVDELFVNFLIN